MKRLGLISITLTLAATPIRVSAHPPGHTPPDDGTMPNPLANALPVTNIQMFVAAMPIPPNAVPAGITNTPPGYEPVLDNVLVYEMRMRTNLVQLHPDLPAVPVWGYSDSATGLGLTPGPTIQATGGVPVYVRWIDELPGRYPDWLPPVTSNHGVDGWNVYNVVHLHGGATRPVYDGNPTFRFRPGVSTNYFYDNIDLSPGADGETLWYHDHALGVTANNVYAGLAGFYLLRNPAFEASLGLPSGAYEIPLAFQDRDVQTNLPPATLLFDPNIVAPWHYLPLVNGAVAPYCEVEPRRYRFRILNGCSFRTLGLALTAPVQAAQGPTNLAVPMYQIGTEDGFLPAPVKIPGARGAGPPTLRLMPGERADVIVDFTDWAGYTNIVVTNSFDQGTFSQPPGPPVNVVGSAFMQFRVTRALSGTDTSRIPSVLITNAIDAPQLASRAVRTRRVTLDLVIEEPFPGMKFAEQTNLFALLNMLNFDDPVTELPRAGDAEIWELVNLSSASHPIHVHLLDFYVLSRTSFRDFDAGQPSYVPGGVANYIVDRQQGQLKDLSYYLDLTTNGVRNVQPNEKGPKDVVHAAPGAVTRIVMQWPTNSIFYGPYVYHCHILDHEDNDMMRPLEVRPPLSPGTLVAYYDPLERTVMLELGTRLGVNYEVQGSTDLVNWNLITKQDGTGMTLYVKDPNRYVRGQPVPAGNPPNPDTGAPVQFYRSIAFP